MIPVILAADCEGVGRVADLDLALGRAEIAIQSLDVAALGPAVTDAERDLRCLYEPLGTHTIARWFRATGIHAFVSGDVDGGRDRLAAARSLEPAYRLDPDLGEPIQQIYAAAEPPMGEGMRLAPPSEGWVVVDGRPTDIAPSGRTYVLQWYGDDGAVRLTRALPAGAPPPYPVAEAPKPAPAIDIVPVAEPVVRRRAPSRALALGGIGAGLLSGAGIAWASSLRTEVLLAEDASSVDGLVTTNRAVGYTAGGLGVAALGLGIGAVAVGRW